MLILLILLRDIGIFEKLGLMLTLGEQEGGRGMRSDKEGFTASLLRFFQEKT